MNSASPTRVAVTVGEANWFAVGSVVHLNSVLVGCAVNEAHALYCANVTHAVASLTNPLLCVVAMGDGIVPPETASAPHRLTSARAKRVIEVGDASTHIAHADLFISNDAHRMVFDPVAQWLGEQDL